MEGIPEKDMQDRRRTLEQKSQGWCVEITACPSHCGVCVWRFLLKKKKKRVILKHKGNVLSVFVGKPDGLTFCL